METLSGGTFAGGLGRVRHKNFSRTKSPRCVGELAEAWKPAADFKSYTVKIRKGVKFHDGKDMTVDDVVYSIDEIWKKYAAASAMTDYAGVASPDADTVVVLSCPELDGTALRRLAWRLERDEVDLVVASALVDVAGARTTIRPFDGLPMLHVEHPRLHGGLRLVKEIVDRVGAFLLLVIWSYAVTGSRRRAV